MNFHLHLLIAARGRLARRLSLVLLPALLCEAGARMAIQPSEPYLRVCLPPPLRFSAPAIPCEAAARTVVLGPPSPNGPVDADGSENKTPATSFESHLTIQAALVGNPPSTSVEKIAAGRSSSGAPVPAAPMNVTPPPQPPPAIIPDDTPQGVHPEDLLPYFRLPSTNSAPLPPSSATYHQQ